MGDITDYLGSLNPSINETIIPQGNRQGTTEVFSFNSAGARRVVLMLNSILNGANLIGTNSLSGAWSVNPPITANNATSDYDETTFITGGTTTNHNAFVYYVMDFGSVATRAPYCKILLEKKFDVNGGATFNLDTSPDNVTWTTRVTDTDGSTPVTHYLNSALTAYTNVRYIRVGIKAVDSTSPDTVMNVFIYSLQDMNLAGGKLVLSMELKDPVSGNWSTIPYISSILTLSFTGSSPTYLSPVQTLPAQITGDSSSGFTDYVIPYDNTLVRLKLVSTGASNVSVSAIKVY